MIKMIAENGIFEIRPDGEKLELYIEGECKGEITSMPQYIRKGHMAVFGCRTTGSRAIECITTGVIRKVT